MNYLKLLTADYVHSEKIEEVSQLFDLSFPLNALDKIDNLYQDQNITLDEKLLTEAEIFLWQNNISSFFDYIKLIESPKYTEIKNELLTIYKIFKNNFEETDKFLRKSKTKNAFFLESLLDKRKGIIERTNNSPIHSIIRKIESEKEIRDLEYKGIPIWYSILINFRLACLGLIKIGTPESTINQKLVNDWYEKTRDILNSDNNFDIFITTNYRRSHMKLGSDQYIIDGTFDPFFINNSSLLNEVLLYEFPNPPLLHGDPKYYPNYRTIYGITLSNNYSIFKDNFKNSLFVKSELIERIWSISLRLANEFQKFKDINIIDFAKIVYIKTVNNLLGALSIKYIFNSMFIKQNNEKKLLGISRRFAEWGPALISLGFEKEFPTLEFQHGINSGETIFLDLFFNENFSKKFLPKYYTVNNLEERLIFDVPDNTHILVGGGLSLPRLVKNFYNKDKKVANKIAIIPTSGDIEKYETNLFKLLKNNPDIFFLLKPHPNDLPYISKYRKMFDICKNIEIVTNGIYELYNDINQAIFFNFSTAGYELFEMGVEILVMPGFEKSWTYFKDYRESFDFKVLSNELKIPNSFIPKEAEKDKTYDFQNLLHNEFKLLLKHEKIGNEFSKSNNVDFGGM